MKYQVELLRQESKTVSVEAETPQEAVGKVLRDNSAFKATDVFEDGSGGKEWAVIGTCLVCDKAILDDYRVDAEGELYCLSCAEKAVSQGVE